MRGSEPIEKEDAMGLPVTLFEVNAPDPDQSARFYSELFGWHTEPAPDQDYVLIDTHARTPEHDGGNGINGGFGKSHEGQAPGSTIYVESPDIQALLEKAGSMGATTLVP